MTPSLSAIQKPVEAHLKRFESMYPEAFSGASISMEEVLSYLDTAKEKRLRPMLVFLSAKLFSEPGDATMRTALFVEMIHTAALVHNNVMENADVPTAVLTGDFILSKAMLLMAGPDDLPLLREMLGAALSMSEGELMERRTENGERNGEDYYLEVITRKTAMMFRACCMGGAMSVGASKEQVALAGAFGLNLGMVFQIRNDILENDETTKMAESLLPGYLEKTMAALEALKTSAAKLSVEVLESFRDLVSFCEDIENISNKKIKTK